MSQDTQQRIQLQLERRELLRDAVFSHLADHPELHRRWTNYQPLDPTLARESPDGIIVVVNMRNNQPTAFRYLEQRPLQLDDAQWLNTHTLPCPNSGIAPEEATLFCISAEPMLKVIALTEAGWNSCWIMQHHVDDQEDHPALSPLHPLQVAQRALGNLPHKMVITAPASLVHRTG